MRDVLICFGLIHLQLCTDVLTYIDVRDVDRQDLESRTVIQTFGKHELTDRIRVLQHLLMTLGTTDRADDTFADTRQDCIFTCTADQLLDVRTHRHTGFSYQLDTVFRHSRYRRCINHFRVYAHLNGFEYITTGEVDCGRHLEGQGDTRLAGTHQRMHYALDMTTGQIVRLQSVALHIHQTGFVRLNHTVHDLCGRHLTDAHQEELHQTDVNTTHCGIDPQHKRYIVQEQTYEYRYQRYQYNGYRIIHNQFSFLFLLSLLSANLT